MHLRPRVWLACALGALALASCGKEGPPAAPTDDATSASGGVATAPKPDKPRTPPAPAPERAAPICTTAGSATACVCRSGFVLAADGKTCDDVDECAADNGGCAGGCANTQGSHYCTCPDGQELGLDGRLCYDPTPVPTGELVTGGASQEDLDAARAAWSPELPPDKDNTIAAPGVFVVDDAARNAVIVRPSELRFPAAGHEDVLTWHKGKVLVSAPSDAGAPGANLLGFARKVLRVETVGDEIVVTTGAAALEEILHGDFQVTFDVAKAREVTWAELESVSEWAAGSLYTNSLPDVAQFPSGLRDDAPPSVPGGDPWGCCVPSFISDAASVVKDKVSAAKNAVVNTAKTAAKATASAAKTAAKATVYAAKTAGKAAVSAAKAAGRAAVSAAKTVGGAAIGAGKTVGGKVAETAETVTSISKAIYAKARDIYEAVMPKSFKGETTFSPDFTFDAIDLSILKYHLKKRLRSNSKYPIEAELSADSSLKGQISFNPKLSIGGEIPNPLAIGELPPLRVWLDVDAALSAKLTLDLALMASIASAGKEAGSKLQADLKKGTELAGKVLNNFRKEVLGNEDTKPIGNWKKTVYLSQPKTAVVMLGEIPVVFTGTFQVDVQCGFELKAQLNAEATLESVHTFKFRAEYEQGRGMRRRSPEYKHTPRFEVRVLGGGEATVSCGVIPRINVFLYDTIGINAGVRGSVIAKAKFESTCAAKSVWPKGEVSFNLDAGIGFPVGARLQAPGSSWGGKDATKLGVDIGPLEVWNTTLSLFEKKFDVPGLGYCTPTCSNGRAGEGEPETDVDCGGECAQGCGVDQKCEANSDCDSGLFCVSGTCSTSTCGDGVRSGDETDVDCGGSLCAPCEAERRCYVDDNCASGACQLTTVSLPWGRSVAWRPGRCAADPCTDGKRSPGECGVDCGGACGLCEDGAMCGDATQCASGQSNRYQCTRSCENLKLDGQETDLDCGGPADCDRCSIGKKCKETSDCAGSAECQEGVCAAVTTPCGAFGQACCAGDACEAGLACHDGLCKCGPDRGVHCGGVCCAAGQLCDNDLCVDPAPTCLEFPTDKRHTCEAGACPASCRAQRQQDPASQSGVYMVQPDPASPPFEVRCDMTRDGGGWTLVGYEAAGQPAAKADGVMASLFAESGTPAEVATGAASGFIGPRFSFARGQYTHLRLNWCDPAAPKNLYESFRTTEEVFADGARTGSDTIALHEFQSNDPVLNTQIPNPDAARFCRARTSAARPGDTSWGVKGASESNFACGCNSGGWTGVGSYYGGTSVQCTSCDCHGGGWAGTAGNGVPKGNVNRNTIYLWLR